MNREAVISIGGSYWFGCMKDDVFYCWLWVNIKDRSWSKNTDEANNNQLKHFDIYYSPQTIERNVLYQTLTIVFEKSEYE